MSRGFSLPGLLVALALGSSCMLLALERYQTVRQGVRGVQQQVADHLALRMLMAELARDLRQHGQAGCRQLETAPAPTEEGLALSWGGPAWPIARLEPDEQGRLQHLLLSETQVPGGSLPTLLLASCTRLDRLQEGRDFAVQSNRFLVRLAFLPGRRLPLGGRDGHHQPSLQLMPLVERRYRLRNGMLWRNDQPLLPLRAFSVRPPQAGLWQLELLPADAALPAWPLTVAVRQRGMAMLLVLVLMLAGLLLLGSLHRLLLDEGRQVNHQRQWVLSLYLAEYGLREAEKQVHGLARRGGYAQWFQPGCRSPRAETDWRQGLCMPAQPGSALAPAWQRRHGLSEQPDGRGVFMPNEGHAYLAPCRRLACRTIPLPGWLAPLSRTHADCRTDPREGPLQPAPCFLVELLDPAYQGGLFRITVRAWGSNSRSSVTLQSYYVAQGSGQRLSWRQL